MRASQQGDEEVVEHLRQLGRMLQVTVPQKLELPNGTIIDRQVVFTIETRRIDNAVHLPWVVMENDRPFPRQHLPAAAGDIARNAHADWSVASEVQKLEGLTNLDLSIAPIVQLAFRDLDLPDDAVALITQDRLQEADLQG